MPDVHTHAHLIHAGQLAQSDIAALLKRAEGHYTHNQKTDKKNTSLKGRTQINLFYEPSTRTRSSFEIAGKRLGIDVINMSVAHSSTKKGESLIDTAMTLNAMSADYIVVRHPMSGTAKLFTEHVNAHVINGGDGAHAHPTQALLDAFTLMQHFETLEGLKITICGDILHSRVARCNAALLKTMGAKVTLVAPPTMMPQFVDSFGVAHTHSMKEGIKGADAIMMLRLQQERMNGPYLGSLDEYYDYYGLSREKLALAKPGALIMHPGPVNRGVEIATELVDDPDVSLILPQVEAGVAVRQAILEWIAQEK